MVTRLSKKNNFSAVCFVRHSFQRAASVRRPGPGALVRSTPDPLARYSRADQLDRSKLTIF